MRSPAVAVSEPVVVAQVATVAFSPRKALLESMTPLLVDVAVPLVSYYLLKAAGLGRSARWPGAVWCRRCGPCGVWLGSGGSTLSRR